MTRFYIRAIVVSASVFWFCFGPLHRVSAGPHSDVFVTNVSGQAVIGGAHDLGKASEHFDLTTRLFEGVMMAGFPPFAPADYGRDEPGFHALPAGSLGFPAGASALPAGASVSVHLQPLTLSSGTDVLFYWNGAGAVDFQPISAAQAGVSFAVSPNPIGSTTVSGGLHQHPVFTLDVAGSGVPADGVYLIAPIASVVGLGDSNRFFMVWLVDALITDEDRAEQLEEALAMGQFTVFGKDFEFFEEAVDWVHDNLIVPEPASGLLAALAAAALAMSSRRRTAENSP